MKTNDTFMITAHITGAVLGTFFKVWLVFWSIDQLFHYRIEFLDGWNLLAGVILTTLLSPRKIAAVKVVGVTNEAR